ncbi:hypothetical protein dqs_0637 [Azoarcus olearius]|uniref:hypothetical protein n=1 Tax=Azoarcus sp. (strain BH72) TaxID=418699 RepID=UPI00080613B4|nr:hypothetical protein [Azoarcus olearius]ANQ83713.1 hypothetical protein dqs_0637 [Azoarcus olearius]
MSLDRNSPAREVLGRLGLIGHPWHGLCRAGVLTLPNGTTRPYAQPASGDAYVLRVPGVPAVERSPEDAADDVVTGRTWLPYAIVSGSDYQIYSRPLGAGRWVYVDSAGDRWLVTTTLHGATLDTLTAGSTITVTLARFGVIGGTPATHTYTVTVPDLGQATPTLYRPTSTGASVLAPDLVTGRLFAIHPSGTAAVFQLAHEVDALIRNSQARWRPCGWMELQITGAGASAAVSLVVLKTRRETVGTSVFDSDLHVYMLYQRVPEITYYEGTSPYPTCGGTRVTETVTSEVFEREVFDGYPDLSGADVYLAAEWPLGGSQWSMLRGWLQQVSEFVIGVAYDATGALEYTTARYTLYQDNDASQELVVEREERTVFNWVAGDGACYASGLVFHQSRAYRVSHSGTTTTTLTISLRRNGVEFESHVSEPVVVTQTWELTGAATTPAHELVAMDTTTEAYGDVRSGGGGWQNWLLGNALAEDYQDQRALLMMEATARIGSTTGAGYLAYYFIAQPYSSSVYGIQRRKRIGQTVQTRSDQHEIGSETVINAGDTVYASRHPVTGALAVDTVPVCWV